MLKSISQIPVKTAHTYLESFADFFYNRISNMELKLKKQFRDKLIEEAITKFATEYDYKVDEFSFFWA